MKDISRGYLVDCTKQRIEIVAKPFNLRWAKVQGALARINTVTDAKEKMRAAASLVKELDEITPTLEAVQKLAGQYPDELSQQVAQGKNLRNSITQLRATLSGFIGK